MMIRYGFSLLCILVPVLTMSTLNDLVWPLVGLKVNDARNVFDAVKVNMKVDYGSFNNSISLDLGCDHALNEAGGLSFLEFGWQMSSDKDEEDEMNIIAELEGMTTKNILSDVIRSTSCLHSSRPRRCRQCRKMALYRGRYYCCIRGCGAGRIPRVTKTCGFFQCTVTCRCRRRRQ